MGLGGLRCSGWSGVYDVYALSVGQPHQRHGDELDRVDVSCAVFPAHALKTWRPRGCVKKHMDIHAVIRHLQHAIFLRDGRKQRECLVAGLIRFVFRVYFCGASSLAPCTVVCIRIHIATAFCGSHLGALCLARKCPGKVVRGVSICDALGPVALRGGLGGSQVRILGSVLKLKVPRSRPHNQSFGCISTGFARHFENATQSRC